MGSWETEMEMGKYRLLNYGRRLSLSIKKLCEVYCLTPGNKAYMGISRLFSASREVMQALTLTLANNCLAGEKQAFKRLFFHPAFIRFSLRPQSFNSASTLSAKTFV